MMVVKSRSTASVCGNRTMTIPVWPGRDGVATTNIPVVVPSYISVMVLNANGCCGTCTITLGVKGTMNSDAPGNTGMSGIDKPAEEDSVGASGIIGSTPGELLGIRVGTLCSLNQS
jgi:hypothetical protein